MSALRWQVLVPRVLAVVVLLLGIQYGVGLVVRTWILSSPAVAGGSFDLAHAKVSLIDRQLVLSDVRLANPRQSGETLLSADHCELNLSAKALLHKQAVVKTGRATGLRLTALTERTADAAPDADWFRGQPSGVADKWFNHLTDHFRPEFIGKLASVQQTDNFCERWSAQSDSLDARAEELDKRTAELQQAFAAAQANPLRADNLLAELPQKLADLHQDFAALRADLDKLPDSLDTERRAIVAARKQDEQLLRSELGLGGVEPDAFTAYLLREQVSRPLNELIGWLRWSREVAAPPARSGRGEDLLFAGCRRQPGLLIQALQLQGAARIGGQPLELRGLLTNAATTPSLHDQPMRLRLRTTGSLPMELQATIDRSGTVPRDQFLVDCHGLLIPQRVLGRADQVELTVAPSVGTLSASLLVEGDKLTGNVQMVQRQVQIVPTVGPRFRDVPLADALGNSLGRVNSLATGLTLGGTLREPTCTLWSNLGPAVAEAMKHALERVGGQHARIVLASAGKKVDERLARVERQMSEQQARLAAAIATAANRLQNVASNQTPRYRISPDRLGRKLPHNSLLR